MQLINPKKFLINYIQATIVILAFFVVMAAYIPVMVGNITVYLNAECQNKSLSTEIYINLNSIIKTNESCALVTPCVDKQKLVCSTNNRTIGQILLDLGGGGLIHRLADALRPFGFLGYQDHSASLISKDLLLIVLFYGIMFMEAGAVIFALWRQNLLYSSFSLPSEGRWKSLFNTFIFALAISAIVIVLMNILNQLVPHTGSQSLFLFLDEKGLIILAVILAPFVEEVIFRGVLLKLFADNGRLLLGSIIVSIIFALIHGFVENNVLWQIAMMSTYFILSLILCWIYIKNKSIWHSILFHSTYNAVMISTYLLLK